MVSIVVKWPWPTYLVNGARDKANSDSIELDYLKTLETNKK